MDMPVKKELSVRQLDLATFQAPQMVGRAPKLNSYFFGRSVLELCSKSREGPGNHLDITFLEFFLHFYNFWVKMVEKNFWLVRISKKYVFLDTLACPL